MGVLVFLMVLESMAKDSETEERQEGDKHFENKDEKEWQPLLSDWNLCPVSLEKIEDPLFCLVDGRLYEKSTVQKMFKYNIKRSPVNRKPIHLDDFVRLVHIPTFVKKIKT